VIQLSVFAFASGAYGTVARLVPIYHAQRGINHLNATVVLSAPALFPNQALYAS
jgi:hypothetical protein